MYIIFGWGKNISAKDMPYRVTNFDLSVHNSYGDAKLANCVPGMIRLNVEIGPTKDPGSDIYLFAVDQHNTASDQGCGKILVYKEKGVDESLQEITFERAWISDISSSVSEMDDKFNISFTIIAAVITVSGVAFEHPGRLEYFQ